MTTISFGQRSPFGAAAAAAVLPGAGLSPASFSSLLDLSQNVFLNSLEKHFDDIRAGVGAISQEVDAVVVSKDRQVSQLLAQNNPQALSQYSGYLSGLRYDRAARFVNGVQYGSKHLADIPTEEESKARVDELVKYFTPAKEKGDGVTKQIREKINHFKTIQDEIIEAGKAAQAAASAASESEASNADVVA